MSILYEFTNSLKTEKAQFRWTDQSVQVLKAGTPLDANGAIANDATAVGIVAYDVPPSGRSMWSVVTNDGSYYADVELITSGYIDEAAAESSCGLEYTDALKGKLADIHFIEGEIGSGGGGQPTEKTERTVVVPEQTVIASEETASRPPLTDTDFSTLNDGDEITVVINGVECVGTAHVPFIRIVDGAYGDNTFVIEGFDGDVHFAVEDGNEDPIYGTYTITAYAENTIYSGASIPDYTADDKGKVLTLAEKVASSVVPVWGSGGGAFIVNDSADTLDKTWAEIKSAYDDGKMVILHKSSSSLLTGDTRDNMPLIQLSIGSDEGNNPVYVAKFIAVTNSVQSPIGLQVYIATSADGNLTIPSGGGDSGGIAV